MKQRLLNYPIQLVALVMLLACSVLAEKLHQDWKNVPGLIACGLVGMTLVGLVCYVILGRIWLLALAAFYVACSAAFVLFGLLPGGITLRAWGLGFGGCLLTLGELVWALARDRELGTRRNGA